MSADINLHFLTVETVEFLLPLTQFSPTGAYRPYLDIGSGRFSR